MSFSRKTHHTLGFRIYKKMLYSLGFINAVMFGGKPYKRTERERETSSLDRTNTHIAAGYWWYFIMSLQVSQISPKIHKTFLVVWTKIPAILPLMTDPFTTIFQPGHRFAWPFQLHPCSKNSHQKGKSFCFFSVSCSQKSMVSPTLLMMGLATRRRYSSDMADGWPPIKTLATEKTQMTQEVHIH